MANQRPHGPAMTRGRVETNLSFYILVMPAAWFVWEGSSSFDGGLL